MKRLTGFAALLLGVALTLFTGTAGAQTYPTSLPHWLTIDVPVHRLKAGQPGYIDSTAASIGDGNLACSAHASTDTTIVIGLSDNSASTGWVATGDSIYVGTLTLTFSAALASTDTVYIWPDVTLDGTTWIPGPTGEHTNLNAGGYLQIVASGTQVSKKIFSVPKTVSGSGISIFPDLYGAVGIRFRLTVGCASAVKTLASEKWTYLSTAPEPGR